MIIEGIHELTHPALLVFETLRDKTQELVAIVPNIEGMQVLERREEPPVVHLYNHWQGAEGDVPRIARPFVKKELISWKDRAAWNEETLRCTWQIEAAVGKEIFTCEGGTSITPNGDDRCTFHLRGELAINHEKVPGLPKFLARKLKGPLERFITNRMSPNLTSMATAVQEYLDAR